MSLSLWGLFVFAAVLPWGTVPPAYAAPHSQQQINRMQQLPDEPPENTRDDLSRDDLSDDGTDSSGYRTAPQSARSSRRSSSASLSHSKRGSQDNGVIETSLDDDEPLSDPWADDPKAKTPKNDQKTKLKRSPSEELAQEEADYQATRKRRSQTDLPGPKKRKPEAEPKEPDTIPPSKKGLPQPAAVTPLNFKDRIASIDPPESPDESKPKSGMSEVYDRLGALRDNLGKKQGVTSGADQAPGSASPDTSVIESKPSPKNVPNSQVDVSFQEAAKTMGALSAKVDRTSNSQGSLPGNSSNGSLLDTLTKNLATLQSNTGSAQNTSTPTQNSPTQGTTSVPQNSFENSVNAVQNSKMTTVQSEIDKKLGSSQNSLTSSPSGSSQSVASTPSASSSRSSVSPPPGPPITPSPPSESNSPSGSTASLAGGSTPRRSTASLNSINTNVTADPDMNLPPPPPPPAPTPLSPQAPRISPRSPSTSPSMDLGDSNPNLSQSNFQTEAQRRANAPGVHKSGSIQLPNQPPIDANLPPPPPAPIKLGSTRNLSSSTHSASLAAPPPAPPAQTPPLAFDPNARNAQATQTQTTPITQSAPSSSRRQNVPPPPPPPPKPAKPVGLTHPTLSNSSLGSNSNLGTTLPHQSTLSLPGTASHTAQTGGQSAAGTAGSGSTAHILPHQSIPPAPPTAGLPGTVPSGAGGSGQGGGTTPPDPADSGMTGHELSRQFDHNDQITNTDQCRTSAHIDGNYGCSGTMSLVQGLEMSNMMMQMAGQTMTSAVGQTAQMNAMTAGTQAAMMRESAKAQITGGQVGTGIAAAGLMAAGLEFSRYRKHSNLAKELSAPAGEVRNKIIDKYDLQTEAQAAGLSPAEEKAFVDQQVKRIGNAASSEQTMPSQMAMSGAMMTMMTAATQMANGIGNIVAGQQLEKAANMLGNQAGPPPASGQVPTFNGQGPATADGGFAPSITGSGSNPATGEGSLGSNEGGLPPSLGPGLNTEPPPMNLAEGPPVSPFEPGGGGSMGGGGDGGGFGGGDTSPAMAQEEGGASMAPEADVGYSSGGTFSGGGGGGGKGADGGPDLSSLLAKFLPQKDEDPAAPKGILDFGKNGPDNSSSFSVLGRDVNIFQRIHETYQDKASHGRIGR